MNILKQVYEMDGDGRRKINSYSLARALAGEKLYVYGPNNQLYEDRARLERTAQWLSNIGVLKETTIRSPADKKKKAKKKAGYR